MASKRKATMPPPSRWRLHASVLVAILMGALIGLAALSIGFAASWGTRAAITYYQDRDTSPVRIGTDYGGYMVEYISKFEKWRARKRMVIIDGMCISSCTMALGLIPPERLCGTEHAVFAFHSAFIERELMSGITIQQFAKESTRLLWHMYPPKVRELLREKYEWDGNSDTEHPDLIYLEGDDLWSVLRKCEAA